MSNNKYEIKKGIRNGAIAGLLAGLVLAVTMFATNTLDLQVLLPTTLIIGAIYGVLTSNDSVKPVRTKDAVSLGVITGLVSFAVIAKPVSMPYTELLVPLLQYAIFGAILGWMTSFLANREEKRKIGIHA